MTWTAVTESLEWQTLARVSEYVAAVNERLEVAESSPLDMPVAGTDIQAAAFWAALQAAVEGVITVFINSHEHPAGFDDYACGSEESFPYYDAATWQAASGLTTAGIWRRVPTYTGLAGEYDADTDSTTLVASAGVFGAAHVGHDLEIMGLGDHEITSRVSATTVTVAGNVACADRRFSILPADWEDYADAAFLYGQMAEGDVVGPWIFADLQAGINPLAWTTHRTAIWDDPPLALKEGIGDAATQEEAYEAAVADWGDVEFGGGVSPYCYAWFVDMGGGDWQCLLYRERATWSVALPTARVAALRWFAWADVDPDFAAEWDGNDDFPAGHVAATLHLFYSQPCAGTTVVCGQTFGGTAAPNQPSDGSSGYGSVEPHVLAEWAFEYHG